MSASMVHSIERLSHEADTLNGQDLAHVYLYGTKPPDHSITF